MPDTSQIIFMTFFTSTIRRNNTIFSLKYNSEEKNISNDKYKQAPSNK